MNSTMISAAEAQITAEKQSESVMTPLHLKAFTYQGVEIDIIDFIRERKLKPYQIEYICNLEVGCIYILSDSNLKRVE